LYKQRDIQDLYEKMKYLVENNEERVNMWKRWRILVEDKLSWKNIAKEYLKL
jgi:glycosyltransferase involved in cell wall biosynthesis